jgi:predicted DNA binding CopG/RHH family protein
MVKRRNYEIVGEFEFEGEEAEKIDKIIEDAEKEIEEARIFFRWNTQQLKLVKKAASLIGIPYQTYIKTVLIERSVKDIKEIEEALGSVK